MSSHMELASVLKGRGEEDEGEEGQENQSTIGGWFARAISPPPPVPSAESKLCGPEASLDEGWKLLHAKEEAKG